MPVLAIQLDVGSTFAHVVRHGFLEIELLAQLIEIANFEPRAELYRSSLGFKFAE